jgi:hypothetical protein
MDFPSVMECPVSPSYLVWPIDKMGVLKKGIYHFPRQKCCS